MNPSGSSGPELHPLRAVFANFSRRNERLVEYMDDPGADEAALFRTYAQFTVINRLLSRWRTVYKRYIRPLGKDGNTVTVLDIGFGGGDILRDLDRWAKQDGFRLRISAIEPDERSHRYVRQFEWPDTISFHHTTLEDVCKRGDVYDVTLTNHVLHHLPGEALPGFLHAVDRVTGRVALMNDLRRSRMAYILFLLSMGPWFRTSFAIPDGLMSIRRSYRRNELVRLTPAGWDVRPLHPFRLLAVKTR